MFPFDLLGQWVRGQDHTDLQHRLPVCRPCPINNKSLETMEM